MDIQDPKNKEKIKALLEQGKTGEFWKMLVQEMNEMIGNIESKVSSDLPAEQYKFENESAKLKVKYIEKLQDLPSNMLGYLESPESKQDDFDPYEDYLPKE